MNFPGSSFTSEWTLFLDRDGVINRRVIDGYVRSWEAFQFLEGVPSAIAGFSKIFGHIIIVSNQQGVGKGLMNPEDLEMIDSRMKLELERSGGRIDASYYSTQLETEGHPDRKPGPGLALKAKSDFPDIDFSKSIMVGDTSNDMIFGRDLGMATVLIGDGTGVDSRFFDLRFSSLMEFNEYLTTND